MKQPDMSDPAVYEITAAKVKLMFTKPFYATLMSDMKLVDATETDWCPTAATDGLTFYYNREFIKSLSRPEIIFLFAHEVLHAVFNHAGHPRRGNRNPQIWNMAIDYLVNYCLVAERIGCMPKGGLYNPEYTDALTSEEIYNILIENSVEVKGTLDVHLEASGEEGEESSDESSTSVIVMGKEGPPKLSEATLEKIREQMKENLVRAAQVVGSNHMPAALRFVLESLSEPKLDWRALLDVHLRSAIRDDYAMDGVSRRTWAMSETSSQPFLLPVQGFMDTIDVCIAIDASGSLSLDMIRDLASEVKGIMDTFKDFRIRIWSFDTECHAYAEFTAANLEDIMEWEPGGGGGTMFECIFDFMREHEIEPHRLIIFTDGLPNATWGDSEYCDTLFIIHGSKTIRAPYGVTAHYEA